MPQKRKQPKPKTAARRIAGSSELKVLFVFLAGIFVTLLWPSTGISFVVVEIPGKGKGVIAARDIQQGELLIREKPLFTVPREVEGSPLDVILGQLSKLPSAERDVFFNLSYVNLDPSLSPEQPDYEAHVALAITETNAIAAGDQGIGVFPSTARLNHGCSSAFNSVYSWREQEGVLVVHALKFVKKGDELLTTYTDTKRPREERQAYLNENYAFRCSCEVCSLPSDLSRRSDERLTKMIELHLDLSRWSNGQIEGEEAIAIISKIWEIGDQEGYWSERGALAADAIWVSAAHSDIRAAREWSHRAIEWFSIELGKDSVKVKELSKYLGAPKLHPAWATRRKSTI